KGPHFLWQFAKLPLAANDVQLFGKHSATPALATVAMQNSSTDTTIHEFGIAILPGGIDDGPFGLCTRKSNTTRNHTVNDATPENDQWTVRTKVRQWSTTKCQGGTPVGGGVSGRSVTIVRLSDGMILRTFGRVTGTPALNDIPAALVTAGVAKDTN